MNGQQAYKILTNMELNDPCVFRFGKRLRTITVSRYGDYDGSVYYASIITTRDNDPQKDESIQLLESELDDYLCQWDDDEWGCSYTTFQECEEKGIDV